MNFLPVPRYIPCERCGASLDRDQMHEHHCDKERWLEYELFQLRDDIEEFWIELAVWLDSPEGRFECFYAEWKRERGDDA
jgi:hypothetical protein